MAHLSASIGTWLNTKHANAEGGQQVCHCVDKKTPFLLGHSKHIEVKYHLDRESIEKGQINVEFIRSEEQLGDVLTKPLKKVKFHEFRIKIGLFDVHGEHNKAQEEIVNGSLAHGPCSR